MKAQIGMEYILMFGVSLLIAGLLWVYSSSYIEDTRWEMQVSYAKSAVNRVTEAADIVHIQGPPAQLYITPTFPDNIKNVYISDNIISIELLWEGRILRNISSSASVNLTGSILATPGEHRILVKASNSNVELIEG